MKKRKQAKLKATEAIIEVVVWMDHFSHDAWASHEEIEPSGYAIESAGFFVKENKKALVIAVNKVRGMEEGSCFMNILKSDIVYRKRFKVKI